MFLFLWQCMYFMLPAYIANMAPVFVRGVPFLDYPVDFNKKLHGQPLLGKNKTFRGFFFGTLLAIVTAFIQHLTFPNPLAILDNSNWFILGLLLGFGALAGDTVKSFVKRRVGLKPGQRFIPWDQLDYALGALLFVSLVYLPTPSMALTIIFASFVTHILAVKLAYYLRIRGEKW